MTFILLINELPTQHRMLIVGNFNLDQMLPEHVAKVDPLIQNVDVPNIQLIYMGECWIWYLILPIPLHYIYAGCSYQQFSFQSLIHNSKILVLVF